MIWIKWTVSYQKNNWLWMYRAKSYSSAQLHETCKCATCNSGCTSMRTIVFRQTHYSHREQKIDWENVFPPSLAAQTIKMAEGDRACGYMSGLCKETCKLICFLKNVCYWKNYLLGSLLFTSVVSWFDLIIGKLQELFYIKCTIFLLDLWGNVEYKKDGHCFYDDNYTPEPARYSFF